MPVIPVNSVVGKKIIIGKKWRAVEEERHKRYPLPKKAETVMREIIEITKRVFTQSHRKFCVVCPIQHAMSDLTRGKK
jgi:hypothetical protein